MATFGFSASYAACACATFALACASDTSRSAGSRSTSGSPALTCWLSTTWTATTVPGTRALIAVMLPSICASSVSSNLRSWSHQRSTTMPARRTPAPMRSRIVLRFFGSGGGAASGDPLGTSPSLPFATGARSSAMQSSTPFDDAGAGAMRSAAAARQRAFEARQFLARESGLGPVRILLDRLLEVLARGGEVGRRIGRSQQTEVVLGLGDALGLVVLVLLFVGGGGSRVESVLIARPSPIRLDERCIPVVTRKRLGGSRPQGVRLAEPPFTTKHRKQFQPGGHEVGTLLDRLAQHALRLLFAVDAPQSARAAHERPVGAAKRGNRNTGEGLRIELGQRGWVERK